MNTQVEAPVATKCPGCGELGSSAFCAECGQRRAVPRLSLRNWLAEFLDDVFSLNGRVPVTIRLLIRAPGALTQEWLAGNRAYVTPFRLYLFCSFVCFGTVYLASLLSGDRLDDRLIALVGRDLDSAARDADLGDTMLRMMPRVMFVLVPFFAVLTHRLFRSARLFHIEHLTFALHVHAFAFLVMAVTVPLDRLPDPWSYVANTPFLLALVGYLFIALHRVFGEGWLAVVSKGLLALAVYLFVLLFSVGVVIAGGGPDPLDRARTAHELYWDWRAAAQQGDANAARELAARALLSYQRLELHAVDAHTRFHLARLQLARGEPLAARLTAEQGLVGAPADPLLLGVAGETALTLADSAAARGYAVRFLSAYARYRNGSNRDLDEVQSFLQAARRLVRDRALSAPAPRTTTR